MMRFFPAAILTIGAVFLLFCTGCTDPRDKFGKTWYIDGAGNWGFGVFDVPEGLHSAGYQGSVANHRWSMTFNPALDQTLRFIAKGSGQSLGNQITQYLKRNPGAEANIIALSAGTGVGIWAIENVKPPHKVNNFILLGSSLSSKYDCTRALEHMQGKIIVYYTDTDPILQGPVRTLGTIDGTFDDSAGLVGLRGKGLASGRIINIARSAKYASLGWTGGHADCTNRRFVKAEISKWIVDRSSVSPRTKQASPLKMPGTFPELQPILARNDASSRR